ncbi:hypothetical protein [Actinomadura keratinilytica]|uniref:hypothetical protein n=1 Tax=Actinomadura keratinilytica TaxID=547461 RepID=UPI0036103640
MPGKGDLRGVQGREREAMGIRSILAGTAERAGEPGAAEPDHFRDLNLDQVVSAVAQAAGLPEVAAYFHRPLRDADLVAFRQEVFRDLEDPAVRRVAERFTASMTKTRTRLEALARRKHPRRCTACSWRSCSTASRRSTPWPTTWARPTRPRPVCGRCATTSPRTWTPRTWTPRPGAGCARTRCGCATGSPRSATTC